MLPCPAVAPSLQLADLTAMYKARLAGSEGTKAFVQLVKQVRTVAGVCCCRGRGIWQAIGDQVGGR